MAFMITRFLPWKFLVKWAARRYGFIDPLNIIARARSFAQPSEVQEPIELLRAGIIFHARGLINARAIQYNLDWVWPYWAERQFNPDDLSFIPRAFSFSHVNLTHRNWTAVGLPDVPAYPIVDPQGMFTPLYDGWSIDCWIIDEHGNGFFPSRQADAEQFLADDPRLTVRTRLAEGGFRLDSAASMRCEDGKYYACLEVEAEAATNAWLVVAVRPYNPEGVQFIENIKFVKSPSPGWQVNRRNRIHLDREPEKVLFSKYHEGDVIDKWDQPEDDLQVHCGVGLATSAAFFPISGGSGKIRILTDLERDIPAGCPAPQSGDGSWEHHLQGAARLRGVDSRTQKLYDTALQTLILLSAGEVVPGPYTYFRFWFRDACLMINSLLAVNLVDRAHQRLDVFPGRQKFSGYFQSQQGEWDSNGQVLWIMERYLDLSGHSPSPGWLKAIDKGAKWIENKRVRRKQGLPHEGLLPAGFSAEHLGPNDYYYWDDFWGLAGLQAASRIMGRYGSAAPADRFSQYARDFEQVIFATIDNIPPSRSRGCIPASPYRRMDAGAVGSLVADYPLQLLPPDDERITSTVEYMMNHCFHRGAFFQDMIHSGINAYLTLDIAQSLLRRGDPRYRQLLETVMELASPTGQWPEAIHPFTGGGCMGDGQHGWAASEFLMLIRNLFVREEAGKLIIGSGIFPEWLENPEGIFFGPTPTVFGPLSVTIKKTVAGIAVIIDNTWRTVPPRIEVRIPGRDPGVFADTSPARLEMEI
ncbi:hypothetical protein [Desulfurivibrio dismutans]|uniref:hypothetical protein n=1 Tax=Desulfurivibrio dismutans TaxID=1398908 RepID=UPI0023DACD38|nr:hypothetical protein [Desulfurivibrio alkaliphilus]MDF1614083.1 hypothetical protein [Desulfurivibrio alkaliphilus]